MRKTGGILDQSAPHLVHVDAQLELPGHEEATDAVQRGVCVCSRRGAARSECDGRSLRLHTAEQALLSMLTSAQKNTALRAAMHGYRHFYTAITPTGVRDGCALDLAQCRALCCLLHIKWPVRVRDAASVHDCPGVFKRE